MTAQLNITSHAALRHVLLVVISFLCVQFASVGHAHEADHDAPEDHRICSVCLVASEPDDEVDREADKGDDNSSGQDRLLHTDAHSVHIIVSSQDLRPEQNGCVRLDKTLPYLASRAPPV